MNINNYFEFLTKEEQNTLNEERFEGIKSDVLSKKINDNLYSMYDILLNRQTKVPTNHQIQAFLQFKDNYLNNKTGYFAEFMEQGLGKTKIALMIAEFLYRLGEIDRILIIAPNDLKRQWITEECIFHLPHTHSSIIWDGFKSNEKRIEFYKFLKYEELKIFAANVEAFSSEYVQQYSSMFMENNIENTLVIVDESATIKNARRKPSPKSRSKRKGSKRANSILDLFKDNKFKLILTGTATPNRPFDLWSQFEHLQENYFRLDYWDFCRRYGEMIQVKRSLSKKLSLELLDQKTYDKIKSDLSFANVGECSRRNECIKPFCSKCDLFVPVKPTPALLESIALSRGVTESGVLRISKMEKLEQYKDLEELKKKIAPVTFFCRTNQVWDMPPKIYQKIECPMTPEQKKVYKEMDKDMLTEFGGITTSTLYKQVKAIRCMQISGGLYPFPVKVIKNWLTNPTEKIHFETIPLSSCGKLDTLKAHTDLLDPEQSKIYWAWFTGEQDLIYKMLCEKYGSAYVGLYRGDNKFTVEKAFKAGEIKHFVSGASGAFGLNLQISNLQYHYSNDFRADIRDQKEARSCRLTQRKPVTLIDLVSKGTKDERVLEILKSKIDIMDYFRTGGEI